MKDQIATLEDVELIRLDDGRILDERQSAAIILFLTRGMKGKALAKAAGYASETTVRRFFETEVGRAGLAAASLKLLPQAGAIGLSVAMQLAQTAKSEKVRLDAAMTLMDRAGLGVADPRNAGKPSGSNGVSINISLTPKQAGLIDVTPATGSNADAE